MKLHELKPAAGEVEKLLEELVEVPGSGLGRNAGVKRGEKRSKC